MKTDPEREIEVQFMDFIELSQNDGLGKLYQLEMVPNSMKGVIVVLSYNYRTYDYKRLLLMINWYRKLFEGDLFNEMIFLVNYKDSDGIEPSLREEKRVKEKKKLLKAFIE